MKRQTVLAVLLVAAFPGSLMIGCSSDSADNADTSTPPANPLVGTWLTEGPSDNPVIVLEMTADGKWTWSWGPSRDKVVDPGAGFGTYEVDGNTVTWLGGACDQGVKGIYTYTLENGQFTQTATDEPCDPRRSAYDGVTYTADTTPPSGVPSDQTVSTDSSQRYTLHPAGTTESPLGYTEYLPPTYTDGKSPLLVSLHGNGESGDGSAEHLSRLAWMGIPMEITRDRWPAERPFVVLPPSMTTPPRRPTTRSARRSRSTPGHAGSPASTNSDTPHLARRASPRMRSTTSSPSRSAPTTSIRTACT